MKNFRLLAIGAFGLLLSLIVPGCTPAAKPGPSAAATPAAMGTNAPMAGMNMQPAAAQVSLAPYYNLAGIGADNSEFMGGIDGDGFECSSNLLGESQMWNGVKFDLGTASFSNVVTTAGQTISLPAGKFSKLEMLAIAVNGAQNDVNFSVAYDDNSSQTFTQSFSDWAQPDGYTNEMQAISMEYRDASDGSRDANDYYISGYTFALDNSKSVKSFTLPSNENVKIFAITLVP